MILKKYSKYLLIVILGIVLIAASTVINNLPREGGVKAKGVIVRLDESKMILRNNRTVWVNYTDNENTLHEDVELNECPVQFRVDNYVPILYDPSDPSRIVYDGFERIVIYGYVSGVFFTILGAALLFINTKKKKETEV